MEVNLTLHCGKNKALFLCWRALITRQCESSLQPNATPWPQMGVNGEDESLGQATGADSELHQQAPDPWMSAWDSDLCCLRTTANRPSAHSKAAAAAPLESYYVVVQSVVVQHVLQREGTQTNLLQIYITRMTRLSATHHLCRYLAPNKCGHVNTKQSSLECIEVTHECLYPVSWC